MRIINKPIKDVYPDAEEIFANTSIIKSGITLDSIYYGIIFRTVIYVALFIFFIIIGLQSHILFKTGFLFIFLIIFLMAGDIFREKFIFVKIYLHRDNLIFNVGKKINILFDKSELSYILLKEFVYDESGIKSKKYHFFSQHHEVIFQMGLLRFVVNEIDCRYYDNQEPPLHAVTNRLFEKLSKECDNLEIINDYNFFNNNKHLGIELKYQCGHFLYMVFLVFIQPVISVFK